MKHTLDRNIMKPEVNTLLPTRIMELRKKYISTQLLVLPVNLLIYLFPLHRYSLRDRAASLFQGSTLLEIIPFQTLVE